jgi:hypothetical protein
LAQDARANAREEDAEQETGYGYRDGGCPALWGSEICRERLNDVSTGIVKLFGSRRAPA